SVYGRRDRDRMNVGIIEEILVSRGGSYSRKPLADDLELLVVQIGDRHEIEPGGLREVPNEVWAPIAVTDNTDVYHERIPFPLLRQRARSKTGQSIVSHKLYCTFQGLCD